MIITTNKNIIHGSRWYKAGMQYDVDDAVGIQLVESGFAIEVVKPSAQPAEKVESKKKSKASSRKAAEVEDVEEAFQPIPEAE